MSINIKIDSKFTESTAHNHKARFARILKEVDINTIQNEATKTVKAIDNMTDARLKANRRPIAPTPTTLKALHQDGVLKIK